ncbi:hypothetical protein [Streptomyces jumonjinensis]|uniref:hypothetical protein n=1 Tax=Streptomyces jumonjinensis TaxID=1945 RepID=UPI00379297BF
MTEHRRFYLQRDVDTTGPSGTGRVADGVVWHDGTASVIWRSPRPSIAFWYRSGDGMTDAEWVHTHCGGTGTRIVWIDPEPESTPGPLTVLQQIEEQPRYELVPGCPHCPDGHMPPDHGQPWGAWVSPDRDGDGQPTTIHVARADGAHVARPDAEWITRRLNGDH